MTASNNSAILEIKDVNKSFGGLKALSNVNLSVKQGSVHAIIGPNGAGKSTLLNCMIAKLIPDTGSVVFDGIPLLGKTAYEINQVGVSRVFQTPEIFGDLNVFDNILVASLAHRDGAFKPSLWTRLDAQKDINEKAEKMLVDMNLTEVRDAHSASLSRGDKRRLELAMCLSQEPKLLLLDEPTAGMARADTNNTIDLLKEISKSGITMVIIEHDMHVVFSLAERITVFAQGTPIVEGLPEEVKGDPKVQEAYLGGAHA